MKIIVDNKIPFIEGRLEPIAEVKYVDPFKFTPEVVKDADALIIRTRTRCDSSLLAGSDVKLIATATIGMDQIDIPWCEKNDITVCNAAGCNAPGVAQYVWSSLLRNGFDPARHTLGVVGHGHIGSIVADWGDKLGAKILVCDPPRKEAGFTDRDYVSLDMLLSESDAVTLHTPLTKSGPCPTYHLIGEKEMAMLKPEAFLINAARGSVVDNKAWVRYLNSNPHSRAIVDVWEGEPNINKELLQKAIIATPHIAGYSSEGKQRATRLAIEAIEKKFGVNINKNGLVGDYEAPESINLPTIITDSYDPAADTEALRKSPEQFEDLRSYYNYRKEVKF